MNTLDYVVLLGSMVGIALYGMWRTRGQRDLRGYLRGDGTTGWLVIGLSVIATQASATTFLSIPGQGYQDGLGFVQNYFGGPIALIIIAIVFLPIYRRLNVYTAYEFLGRRFDTKTRLLGAGLFLLQRGIGAGLTIYAPAILLSAIFGWSLSGTIIATGLLVVVYTTSGGSEAVTLTQKYQLGVIFAGMVAAFVILVAKLPDGLGFGEAMTLANSYNHLNAVNFSPDLHERYTFWSGLLGGGFLALSYFGTDQSQVQRYLCGASLRESRLGLMFHAVVKIPMQFFILLLGVLMFVFYQFETSPMFFNQASLPFLQQHAPAEKVRAFETKLAAAQATERENLASWLQARRVAGDQPTTAATASMSAALDAHQQALTVRKEAADALKATKPPTAAKDTDYVFISFILQNLPHGLIGLLVTCFFASALSSKAGELNALGSTTVVDVYRHVVKRDASDAHYVLATKVFTVFWGLVAILIALFANLSENLVQAANILGSLFYGVPLGLFLVAFFIKRIGGTAVFWGALAAEALVLLLYFQLPPDFISYLWYNFIGCALCVLFSQILQAVVDAGGPATPEEVHP